MASAADNGIQALLKGAFGAAVRAASPSECLPPALDGFADRGPALVLGAGKAAASMAAAFAKAWQAPVRGLVVTRYGHGLAEGESAGAVEVIEAGHPSPDAASLDAGARLLALASGLGAGDRLFCLVSGGGSALASAPVAGLEFDRKRAAANYLIRSGADIREINCVRKHLSGLKGGRLARAAHPAEVVTITISDVPGDDPAIIASGPTIPDATTQRHALDILGGYGYPALAELETILRDPRHETPKPGEAEFERDSVHMIATAATALAAAAEFMRGHGYTVIELGDDLDGEAVALGREHARLAMRERQSGAKIAILSGGETRVVLGDAEGRGGRNLEYLSGLALELGGCPGIYAVAADTDGIDGRGDHAGAVVTPDVLQRGLARGVSLESALARHDSYAFFDACGLLLKTGPTRTNVNDFRLVVYQP